MVKTMDAAVDRFKEQMKKTEQEKLMQAEDFKWRIQAEQELMADEHKKRSELQARHYLDLVAQVKRDQTCKEDSH
jgi:hypothetical protein